MFGVLVVQTTDGQLASLSAFSGMLGGQWHREGFAPPVFNLQDRNSYLQQGEERLAQIVAELATIDRDPHYSAALQNLSEIRHQASLALEESRNNNRLKRQQREKIRLENPDDKKLAANLDSDSREDKRHLREMKRKWKDKEAAARLVAGSFESRIELLCAEQSGLSNSLQSRVFDGYVIDSFSGEKVAIKKLFSNKLPPGGAGDCAAVKLLRHCVLCGLKPVCLAEFWWGSTPSGGIRHHGKFYPACRGKCGVILPFMLRGVATTIANHELLTDFPESQPEFVFEDDQLIVVNKPSGMLSVPGKSITDSVEQRLRARYPQASNASMLVHRLDQATSGLLLAAKNSNAHRHLQRQFLNRQVVKRYCADLAGIVNSSSGTIDLPIRVDIDDRPRQLVCHEHGKRALTKYRVLQKGSAWSRVEFEPVTGRTHQLRVHAAHGAGLNTPVVGDELYGTAADRLHLHAEYLSFIHPVTEKRLEFTVAVPF